MALQPSNFGSSNVPSLYPDPFWWRSSLRDAQNQLDLFDPFDEFDRNMGRNFHWFFKPEFTGNELATFPRVPHKYRITVDCAGFRPDSIKFSLDDSKRLLTITALEETKYEEDFNVRHFRKTYKLPENALPDQMVSFMANNQQLIVEVPLMESEMQPYSDLMPQIVDSTTGGGKQVSMRFNLPPDVDPERVNVSVKGHDVILRAEHRTERPDAVSHYHYYQRTTLPEHTRMDSLRCVRDSTTNQINVSAPLDMTAGVLPYKSVPIENWRPSLKNKPLESTQAQRKEM